MVQQVLDSINCINIEESDDIISDGIIDLYYDNKVYINIAPKGLEHIYIKHSLSRKAKGIIYIILDDEIKEYGISVLDNILLYDGEERVKISLYNYGPKSCPIEHKDTICTLILNELESEDD